MLRVLAVTLLAMTLCVDMPAETTKSPVFAAQEVLLQQAADTRALDAVSPEAQDAIAAFKEALMQATDRALRSLAPTSTLAQVHSAVADLLPGESVGAAVFKAAATIAEAPGPGQTSVSGLYGSGLRLRLQQPRPDLVLVEESFVLPCGDDTLLLGYHADANGWTQVLRWQSARYASLDGAFGDSFAALALQAESSGLPLLVVKHGKPACSGSGSMLSLSVLELSARSAPKVIWSATQPYRRFNLDYLSRIAVTSDGFSLHASFASLDKEQIGKELTRSYRVNAHEVSRRAPLAQRSVDIVDEWFQMPWSEAKAYVDSADRRDLEGIHWRVFKESGSHQHLGPVTYVSQRSCNDSPTRQQVELDLRPDDAKTQELAMVLVEPASDQPIRFASATMDPACDGRDQLHGDESHPHVSK